jgi:hypothetical protein
MRAGDEDEDDDEEEVAPTGVEEEEERVDCGGGWDIGDGATVI